MIIKKRYIFLLFICVAIVARIIYVNVSYDSPPTIYNELGESFMLTDQFEIKVISMDAYSKGEWKEKLKRENLEIRDVCDDYVTIVVEYQITNTLDTEGTFYGGCIYAQIGTARNGRNIMASEILSGGREILASSYRAGESRIIKQVYTLDQKTIKDSSILSEKMEVAACNYSGIHIIKEK